MRLQPIQALRGMAALAVAMSHAGHEASLYAAGAGRSFEPVRLPWDAGVDVFFVISGFVMVYASRGMFGRPEARRHFLARRVARVVPLYWVTSAAYLGVALASPSLLNGGPATPSYVLASFLFIPVARPDGLVQPLYSLGWTLNYEMAFYVVFAAALGWTRDKALAALCVALAGLAGIGALAAWPQPIAFWTHPIILEFAAGALLGRARLEGTGLSLPPRIALAGAAIILLVAVSDRGTPPGWERALLWGVPAACLVASCGLSRDEPWDEPQDASLVGRLGAALGDASYALYLVHPFAIRGVREILRHAGAVDAIGPAAFLVLALLAAVAAGFALHHLVERPLTRAARRMLDPADGPALRGSAP